MLLTTDRLIIKKITTTDAPFYFALLNSPGFLRNIGDRHIRSIDVAANYIKENILSSYNINGFGFYKMVKQGSDETIGICGFVKRDYLNQPDFGYSILPEFEGMGYTTEAAKAILAYGCKEWNLSTVLGITRPNNSASRKLLEKLGFQTIGKTIDPSNKEELLIYEYKYYI